MERMTMLDARTKAAAESRETQWFKYAVETADGWTIADNKPSFRVGKVLEYFNGEERHA